MTLFSKSLFISLLLFSGLTAMAGSLEVSPNYRKLTKELDSGYITFSVALTNTSSQTKSYVIVSENSWITTSASSMTLSAGETKNISVTLNASAHLWIGTHFGFVSFGDGPILTGSLTVELNIVAPRRPPEDIMN